MTNPTFWNQIFIWPIVNLLLVFYKIFEFLRVPGPLGFAVIGLTILVRLLLYPLMAAQLRSAKKMQRIKPHLDALAAKHKDDKVKLQQAQLDLYKQHGVNPAAGCLPLLIQFPVLIALYNVFYQVLLNGNAQKIIDELNRIVYHPALQLRVLDLTFFGINLGIKPSQWQTDGWWLLLIPVITAVLQWWQTKLMLPAPVAQPAQQTQEIEKKDGQKKQDDMAEMQKQMALMTPILFGFFAYQFPLGLALYWNIFGIMGMLQQVAINKEK